MLPVGEITACSALVGSVRGLSGEVAELATQLVRGPPAWLPPAALELAIAVAALAWGRWLDR